MLKNVLLGIAIVIIGGTIGYFGWNAYQKTQVTTQNTTLVGLILSGVTQSCSVEDGKSKATFYLGEGKTYAEFYPINDKQNPASYLVTDGKNTYLWQGQSPFGFIMQYDLAQGDLDNAVIPTGASIDSTRFYDFKCSPWKLDINKFSLPENVSFQDPTKNMQKLPNQATDGGTVIYYPSQ